MKVYRYKVETPRPVLNRGCVFTGSVRVGESATGRQKSRFAAPFILYNLPTLSRKHLKTLLAGQFAVIKRSINEVF